MVNFLWETFLPSKFPKTEAVNGVGPQTYMCDILSIASSETSYLSR